MPSASKQKANPARLQAPIPFRIFLATPGDVLEERRAVRLVVERLVGDPYLGPRVRLELVAWDPPGKDVAMDATLTPQEAAARGLPRPEECDLALVVLWSRMGTPLPGIFGTKPGGSPYLSGTEWEYCNAVRGRRRRGRPVVWVFRRTQEPRFGADDPALADKLVQWRRVKDFFASFVNPDGAVGGDVIRYELPSELERDLEQHLREHLSGLIADAGLAALPASVSATPVLPRFEGVPYPGPYPGLNAFTPEQAPVFFGRGRESDQLVCALTDPALRFLAVVGGSGCGKSSLVQAGLIPRLRGGAVGAAAWRDLTFRPGERGGDPFLALAHALAVALGTAGRAASDLAEQLRAEPGCLADRAAELLEGTDPGGELLLVVDQLEELFTQVGPQDLQPFVGLLSRACSIPRVRLVATVRADSYIRVAEEPQLADLLRSGRGTFPLDPPGPAALRDMIAGPAGAAGLRLEKGLVDRILKDAGGDAGALALIAFAMHELCARGRETGRLSLADYRRIGGVAGAVRTRAEKTLERRAGAADGPDRLFAHLVDVHEREVPTRRRTAKARLGADAAALAEALTGAGLLVTGRGANEEPTIEIAHEALLGAWPRLAGWIERSAEALRARRDLENTASEWHAAGRPGRGLRTGALLTRYRAAAQPRSDLAAAYLRACSRKVLATRVGLAAAIVAAVCALWVFCHVGRCQYPPALVAQGASMRLGIRPVPESAIVEPMDVRAFMSLPRTDSAMGRALVWRGLHGARRR